MRSKTPPLNEALERIESFTEGMLTKRNIQWSNLYAPIIPVLGVLVAMSLFPLLTHAETTEVINNISVSAESSGNSAGGGEVVEGKATGSIFVETIINGEVIEYFKRAINSHDEDFTESFEFEDEDVEVKTQVEIRASSDTASPETEAEEVAEKPREEPENPPAGGEEGGLELFNSAGTSYGERGDDNFSFTSIFSRFITYVFGIFAQ